MFCSSAVCPLTSPKSVLRSALTCQSAALCTASPLLCLSPGTTAFIQPGCLFDFQSLNASPFIFYFRLAQLLGHDFILKPQYDFVACDTADVWLSCTHMTATLTDPLLIEASCPLTMSRMSHCIWTCYIKCARNHHAVRFHPWVYIIYNSLSWLVVPIFRWHFSGSELGVCGLVQPAKYLHLCWSGIQWCSLSDQRPL